MLCCVTCSERAVYWCSEISTSMLLDHGGMVLACFMTLPALSRHPTSMKRLRSNVREGGDGPIVNDRHCVIVVTCCGLQEVMGAD